jgi:hypothetical protein
VGFNIAAIEAAGEKLEETASSAPAHDQLLQQVGSCNLDETDGATSHHQVLQEIG